MREHIKSVLQKTGSLKIAFRIYEVARAFNVQTLRQNAQYRRRVADDGLPIPAPLLIGKVDGTANVAAFLDGGKRAEHSIRGALEKNGLAFERFQAVLDFGCGCGRVIRRWHSVPNVQIHGTDYNPHLIEWCQQNLPFAHFEVNGLQPPLNYPDATFDFIYALSVFTHLPEALQQQWMVELGRVLKPGGCLLITLHGEYYLTQLTPDEYHRFQAGEWVVKYEECAGTNMCAAFCSEAYIYQHLARGFDVVMFVAQGAEGNPHQDLYLLRKNTAGAA